MGAQSPIRGNRAMATATLSLDRQRRDYPMKKFTLTADTEVTVSLGFVLKFGITLVLLHRAPELVSLVSGI